MSEALSSDDLPRDAATFTRPRNVFYPPAPPPPSQRNERKPSPTGTGDYASRQHRLLVHTPAGGISAKSERPSSFSSLTSSLTGREPSRLTLMPQMPTNVKSLSTSVNLSGFLSKPFFRGSSPCRNLFRLPRESPSCRGARDWISQRGNKDDPQPSYITTVDHTGVFCIGHQEREKVQCLLFLFILFE